MTNAQWRILILGAAVIISIFVPRDEAAHVISFAISVFVAQLIWQFAKWVCRRARGAETT